VNRFRPELVAEQMTAQKHQGNVIRSAQILQLENVIAALKDGMNIPKVVVKFEVSRARRFRALGYGKHNG
jgi:hypothetical protein